MRFMIVKSRARKSAPQTRKAKTNGTMCFFILNLSARQEPPEKKDQCDEHCCKEQRPRPWILFLLLSQIIHVVSLLSTLLIDAADDLIYDHAT